MFTFSTGPNIPSQASVKLYFNGGRWKTLYGPNQSASFSPPEGETAAVQVDDGLGGITYIVEWEAYRNGSGTFESGERYTISGSPSDSFTSITVDFVQQYTHTLSYWPNEGDNCPKDTVVTDTSRYSYVTVTDTIPTRSGYIFSHWNEQKDDSGSVNYTGGDRIEVGPDETINLYAIWKQYKHTLSYYPNGGSNFPPDTVVADASKYSNVTVTSSIPTRTGYFFRHWNKYSNNSGAIDYVGGDKIEVGPDETIKLYAIWRLPYSYTISYDTVGGTPTPGNQTKKEGETVTLWNGRPSKSPSTSNSNFYIYAYPNGGYFTDNGSYHTQTALKKITTSYSFSNWKDSSNTSWSPGESYSGNHDLSLTAQYSTTPSTTYSNNQANFEAPKRAVSVANTYTTTFNSNGGTCSTKTLKNNTGTSYRFKGWSNSSNSNTVLSNLTFYSTTYIYAVWESHSYISEIELPTPYRAGYEFLGWTTSINGTDYMQAGSFIRPNKNQTLYAAWKPKGAIRLYINNGYKLAQPCIYTTSKNNIKKWCLAMPETFNENNWRISGG